MRIKTIREIGEAKDVHLIISVIVGLEDQILEGDKNHTEENLRAEVDLIVIGITPEEITKIKRIDQIEKIEEVGIQVEEGLLEETIEIINQV